MMDHKPNAPVVPVKVGLRQWGVLSLGITMTTTMTPQRVHLQVCRFALAAALLVATALHAALPNPLVKLRFSEGSGTATTNTGTLGGSAVFVQNSGYPQFTNLVATGAYSPGANTSSVDFGDLGASHGAEQVNLTTDTNLISDGTLGTNLSGSFTLCGWINVRILNTGWGGNRILCALPSAWGSGGFDLVYNGDGSLQFAINTFADDGGVKSSSGKITADPAAGTANWVFFGVTFDPSLSNNNLKFYFGQATNLASLDSQANYKSGNSVYTPGKLTVGNVGPGTWFWNDTGNSRALRGAVDEVQVFNYALSLSELQEAQCGGVAPPVAVTITAQPSSLTVFEGQPATFTVGVSGSAPISFRWQTNNVTVPDATNAGIVFSSANTNLNGIVLRVSVANPITTAFWSSNVTLTVLPEDGLKVFTSLSASPANNAGNLQGYGTFNVRNGYPCLSTNVPSGPFAPTNNAGSVDFGVFTNYSENYPNQAGGRAINFANLIGNGATMGYMAAFTICGWLNCADLEVGSGGNRIAYCLDQQNHGFDLVHTIGGSLKLGVNEWPDYTPVISSAMITADPAEGAPNWVFFAVTYDGTLPNQNVTFYFGNADQPAQTDVTADYNKGPILQSGILGIGNANATTWFAGDAGTNGVRSFRGLIDELHVFNKVLTLEQIQAVQMAPAAVPPPQLSASLQNGKIAIRWVSSGNFQLQSRSAANMGPWANVTNQPTVGGNTHTVTLGVTNPAQFYRLQGQ
jgi:hypothetical protein